MQQTPKPHPRRRALLRTAAAIACCAALVGGYVYWWRVNLKRFTVVRPGVFYRMGQPTELGFRWLLARHHIRTVLSVQLEEIRLYTSPLDLGQPDGDLEATFTSQLGAEHVQWPMGAEPYWPWPTPWQLENFLALCDDPARWPIALHCQGGRHRTGTLSAIFRLEYDRWPVERALEEMYRYDFGGPIPLQELNLRTYVPRPWPSPAQWNRLSEFFGTARGVAAPMSDYPALLAGLHSARAHGSTEGQLAAYIGQRQPFALPLAARVVQTADDPLSPVAVRASLAEVDEACQGTRHDRDSLASAAALIADFGDETAQRSLLNALRADLNGPNPSPTYQALVAGITNRYTRNRLPFLRVLLDDARTRPEPAAAGTRYCDTAVARAAVIGETNFLSGSSSSNLWDDGRRQALAWFEAAPERTDFARLTPPHGKTLARGLASGRHREDLSRARPSERATR